MELTVKSDLRDVWQAETRTAAQAVLDTFAGKYDKAVACLTRDREALRAFFDFPAEHWDHLRTANPIESVFATVRHRTVRTKGALSQNTAKLMVFTLVRATPKKWRRLKGANPLPLVVDGIKFADGVAVDDRRNPRRLIRPRHPNSARALAGRLRLALRVLLSTLVSLRDGSSGGAAPCIGHRSVNTLNGPERLAAVAGGAKIA